MNISELTVILVEPSSTQAHIVTNYLQAFRIETIDVVQTGKQALAEINTTPPNLVISTLYLPDMTGTDLLYAIRNDQRLQETAFILVSSETRLSYLDPIRQAGATAILAKPFDQEDLFTALNSTLDYLDAPELNLNEVDTETLQVLLVDDSLMSRNHLRRLLNGMGIEHISEAHDGKAGAQMINEHYYDLVISDYNMPEMDGQELIDFIRNGSGQPSLPVIMVTSETDESRLAGIQKSGVSAICDKPFEPNTLKRYLEKLLHEDKG